MEDIEGEVEGEYLVPEHKEFWLENTASVTEAWVLVEKTTDCTMLRRRLVRIAAKHGWIRGLPLHAQQYLLKHAPEQSMLWPDGRISSWIDGIETILTLNERGFVGSAEQRTYVEERNVSDIAPAKALGEGPPNADCIVSQTPAVPAPDESRYPLPDTDARGKPPHRKLKVGERDERGFIYLGNPSEQDGGDWIKKVRGGQAQYDDLAAHEETMRRHKQRMAAVFPNGVPHRPRIEGDLGSSDMETDHSGEDDPNT